MPNQPIADLIAQRLTRGLPHPGTDNQPAATITLPGLSTVGMTEQQATEFVGDFTQLIGEAVVCLIETDGGSQIVPTDELKQLRSTAARAAGTEPQTINITCHCGTVLMQIMAISDTHKVDGSTLIKALVARNPDCPHEGATP